MAAKAIITRLRWNIQLLPGGPAQDEAAIVLVDPIFPENNGEEKQVNRWSGCISSGIGMCDNKPAACLPRRRNFAPAGAIRRIAGVLQTAHCDGLTFGS